jgi:prepilin peptidase CpaA
MWMTALGDHPLPWFQWAPPLAATLVAAVTDWRSRRIPNVLTLPLFFSGLIASAACAGSSGLVDSMMGSVLAALPFILLFVFAGGGAGDAKLMGALGAWLGAGIGLILVAAVLVSGMFIGLAFALATGRLRAVAAGLSGFVHGTCLLLLGRTYSEAVLHLPTAEERTPMPFALAILAGTWITAGAIEWNG